MQVLVKNIYCQDLQTKGLSQTFWDPDSYEMGAEFSVSSVMELSGTLGLSPYFVVDARVAFMVSQLNKGSVYVRGLGDLAATLALMKAGSGYVENITKKLDQYIKEYLPSNPLKEEKLYQQILTFGEKTIDSSLWDRLSPGGFYYMGVTEGELNPSGVYFEAFGKLWPYGEATEFGWRFGPDIQGLSGFEFAKLRKSA